MGIMARHRYKCLLCPRYLKAFIVISAVVFVFYKLAGYFIVLDTDIKAATEIPDDTKVAYPKQESARFEQTTDRSVDVEQMKLWNLTDNKQYPADAVFVLMPFANAHKNVKLQSKFRTCITSMSDLSTVHIVLFVCGDPKSWEIAWDIVEGLKKKNVEAHHVALEQIGQMLQGVVTTLQLLFTNFEHSYYGSTLFFLSPALHRVTPLMLQHLIILDADLLFRKDILGLHNLFHDFLPGHILGIAYENQPVYRHVLSTYRRANPGTSAGDPPPQGFPGFNSGVLLLDLGRMRASERYNSLLDSESVRNMSKKYSYTGHLGDQDFYTLLALENEDLFFRLPCGWNRQLCKWWRENGYRDVFDDYFACNNSVGIYHGNCDTPFPAD